MRTGLVEQPERQTRRTRTAELKEVQGIVVRVFTDLRICAGERG